MTTIQIDDSIRPTRSHDASGVDTNHGIVFARTRTFDKSSTRGRSLSRRRPSLDVRSVKTYADWDEEDPDSGIRQAGDFKKRQTFSGRYLLWLAYQSIGVIYGDIGTSPLYVFSSTFTSEPSHADLLGVLSIVLWSLIMMVTVKYIIIILHADNEGEGGTFSTYSLLSRYARITNRDPREASLIKMERYQTGDLPRPNEAMRTGLEKSKFFKGLLKTIGVLAVSMVMSDGVLTPAQSVLGAVQGLNVVKPDITNGTVVGATCGILICLFLIQPFGTTKISYFFAPIIIIWLGFNAAFGIYNLAKYDYTILKAFNPGYAFEFLIRNKEHGWRQLGGVLLAFTGVEALFADLGAFSMRAIQLSWLCWCLPSLFLAYTGQAAFISVHPAAYSNPFFNSAPPGTLYPALVIAILAAIVASQAIITATFQLLAQIMKLSYFPQIKVVHTSKTFHGQLYVPLVNWLLMIGTVLVAAIYNNTTSLGNAYGVCVMFVTFFDTCMVSLAAIIVWRIKPYYVFLPWLTIACMDGTFLSSALTKVPDGAWFTLTLATVLASCFILWRFGKEQQWAAEAEDRFPTSHFVREDKNGDYKLTGRYGGEVLSTTKGFGIFFDKAGETTPIVFSQFIGKLVSAPEIIVFFHMRPIETPTVSEEDRYTITRLALRDCYRVVVRHGYMDQVITPDLSKLVYDKVYSFLMTQHVRRVAAPPNAGHPDVAQRPDASIGDSSTQVSDPEKSKTSDGSSTQVSDPEKSKTSDLYTDSAEVVIQPSGAIVPLSVVKLQKAYEHRILYIIGKEEMMIKPKTGIFRRVLLEIFLFLRHNTRNKMAHLKVPMDRLVEVGFVKQI